MTELDSAHLTRSPHMAADNPSLSVFNYVYDNKRVAYECENDGQSYMIKGLADPEKQAGNIRIQYPCY